MDEISVDLASVASFCIVDGVRKHFRPVVSHSFDLVAELWTGFLSFTCVIVSFFEDLLFFLG